jgi:glycosyltransferase involved in cell wall biosynthesis
MTIQISVIIPTFNRLSSLRRTLEGLEAQTLRSGYEVIVSVDGSADGTLEFLREKVSLIPWLHFVWSSEQKGAGAARNRGVERSRGPICLFIDDDILPSSTVLDAHLKAHRGKVPRVVMGMVLADAKTTAWDRLIIDEILEQIKRKRKLPLYFTSWFFSITRQSFLDSGRFSEDPEIAPREDRELGWKLHRMEIAVSYEEEAHGLHLRHLTCDGATELFFNSGRALIATLKKHPDMLLDPLYRPTLDIFLKRLRALKSRGDSPAWNDRDARGELDGEGMDFSEEKKGLAWDLLFRWQLRGALYETLRLPSYELPCLPCYPSRLPRLAYSIRDGGSFVEREMAATIREAFDRSGLFRPPEKNDVPRAHICPGILDAPEITLLSPQDPGAISCSAVRQHLSFADFPWCVNTRFFMPRPDLCRLSFPGRKGFLFIGCQVSEADLEALFESFFKVFSTSRSVFLALWLPVEEAMGGRLLLPRLTSGRPPGMPPVIVFRGPLKALKRLQLYNEAEFHLHMGEDSGSILFLLEAMACARGIISLASPTAPEILSGERGFTVKSSAELEKAFHLALNKPQEIHKRGVAARQAVVRHWGQEAGPGLFWKRIHFRSEEVIPNA